LGVKIANNKCNSQRMSTVIFRKLKEGVYGKY